MATNIVPTHVRTSRTKAPKNTESKFRMIGSAELMHVGEFTLDGKAYRYTAVVDLQAAVETAMKTGALDVATVAGIVIIPA